MDLTLIVVGCSVVLQSISALLAIRLSLLPGRRSAGLIILTAITLMAVRRIITFHRLTVGDVAKTDLFAELIALIVSFIFMVGIVYITRLIKSYEKTAETLWESQEVMETIIETAPT